MTGKLKDSDYDTCSFNTKKISGIKTLQATLTDCDTMVLTVESVLEQGNMELVIIIDNAYYQHIPINQTSTVTLNGIAEKKVIVRMAAESASCRVSLSRNLINT